MTANGAKEYTLQQMEDTFGLSTEDLNQLLNLYLRKLPHEDKLKVSIANSIWYREVGRINVQQQFLQTNANYYGAKIYRSSFDLATLPAINDWVKDETDGMIEDILDEIPDETMMYLINALAFDAEYLTINSEDQIGESTFTPEDGEKDAVRMMFSMESKYLDDGKATGFIKDYAGGRYTFVALLPNEGTSVSDYLATFTGESLHAFLHAVEETPVFTMMPRFESEYKIELSALLEDMGMENAFDEKLADLKGLGHLRKATSISVVSSTRHSSPGMKEGQKPEHLRLWKLPWNQLPWSHRQSDWTGPFSISLSIPKVCFPSLWEQ